MGLVEFESGFYAKLKLIIVVKIYLTKKTGIKIADARKLDFFKFNKNYID